MKPAQQKRSDSVSSWDREEQAYKIEVQARRAVARTASPADEPKVRVARQRADSPRSWDSHGRSFSARQSSASSHDVIEVQRSMVGSLDYNIRPAERRSSSPAEWDIAVQNRRDVTSDDASSCESDDWDMKVESGLIGGDGHDNWRQNTGRIGGDGHDNWQHKGGKIGGDGHDNWRQNTGIIGGGDHD
jgi:hypothetical protein